MHVMGVYAMMMMMLMVMMMMMMMMMVCLTVCLTVCETSTCALLKLTKRIGIVRVGRIRKVLVACIRLVLMMVMMEVRGGYLCWCWLIARMQWRSGLRPDRTRGLGWLLWWYHGHRVEWGVGLERGGGRSMFDDC